MIAWPEHFYELPESQQEMLEKLASKDLAEMEYKAMTQVLLRPGFEEAFLVRYFPHRLTSRLEDFHLRLIHDALYEKRDLTLFPAGHGKTTLITCLLPILEMIRDPDIRIVEILKNDNEAAAVIMSIKSELEQNDLLIADYGPFRPAQGDPMRSWSSEAVSIQARRRLGKEHTLTVFGAGSRLILGWRSDWVIMDDVVTEKNSNTEDQRAKHVTWFNDCVMTSPEKKKAGEIAGRITAVGTMFHPRDLYAYISEIEDADGNHVYKVSREDAIRDWEAQEVLWPALYTWQDMMNIRRAVGALSFNKRYRNKPVDESEQPFHEEDVRACLDPNLVMGEWEPHWRIFQGLDPAVGKGKNAKRVGHVVIGIDPDQPEYRYVVEVGGEQLTVPQQRDLLISTALRYGVSHVCTVVEENAYQAGLSQITEERMNELGITFRLEGHTTGKNKQDPEIGIPSLGVLVEKHLLRIPYGDRRSKQIAERFIVEMVEYPFYAFSDQLMALWFVHLKSNVIIPNYRSFNYLNPKSMYRRHMHRRTVKNPYWDKGAVPRQTGGVGEEWQEQASIPRSVV